MKLYGIYSRPTSRRTSRAAMVDLVIPAFGGGTYIVASYLDSDVADEIIAALRAWHSAQHAPGRKAMNTWDAKRSQINTLLEELQGKPDNEKFGHWLNPESILNAYREGDLLFTDAVQELKKWAIMYVNRAPHT